MFRNVSVYRRNTLVRVGVKGSCHVSANMTARDGTNYQSMMTSSKPRRWPELVMIAELLGRLADEDQPIQPPSLHTRGTTYPKNGGHP